MTLQELRYLVAVADHLHFGRAADACHVTQPTLSAGVRSLEDHLGRPLFERGPRRVLLATGAEAIVEKARRILAEADELERMARLSEGPLVGEFRLGAIPTIGPYLYPHVVAGVRRAWPDLRLHLVEGKTEDLLRDLRRGDLDAALLSPPLDEDGLSRATLYREDFLLALPSGHRLTRKKKVRLADLDEEPLLLLDEGHCLRDQVVDFCRIGQTDAREQLRSSSLETLRNMVAGGMGCTLMPELAIGANETFETRRMTRPAPSREVALYWRRSFAESESVKMMAETIRKNLPDSVRAFRR